MNTVKKGAAYEKAFREQYNWVHEDDRTKVYWQPPKPRQHSTGFDSMSWTPGGWATLWEFKSGRISCAEAEALSVTLGDRSPLGAFTAVVHRTRETKFCEH